MRTPASQIRFRTAVPSGKFSPLSLWGEDRRPRSASAHVYDLALLGAALVSILLFT